MSILKCLLELIKLCCPVMDVDLCNFNNFPLHLGVADTVITLPLFMQ